MRATPGLKSCRPRKLSGAQFSALAARPAIRRVNRRTPSAWQFLEELRRAFGRRRTRALAIAPRPSRSRIAHRRRDLRAAERCRSAPPAARAGRSSRRAGVPRLPHLSADARAAAGTSCKVHGDRQRRRTLRDSRRIRWRSPRPSPSASTRSRSASSRNLRDETGARPGAATSTTANGAWRDDVNWATR